MSRDSHRLILLTGSPLRDTLQWDDTALTTTELLPAFTQDGLTWKTLETLSTNLPTWRSLPFYQGHLPTGLTQASRNDDPFNPIKVYQIEPSCFTTSQSTGSAHSNDAEPDANMLREEDASDYYEQSFVLHNEFPSSQIVGSESSFDNSSSVSTEYYSAHQSQDESSASKKVAMLVARLHSLYVCDLGQVPTASYINSINPQTMTVNLVVGILTISPPRRIRTRREGKLVDIVEMTVGDETRSGFGLNIWLAHRERDCESNHREREEAPSSLLRRQVLRLRPGDVVLASKIALASFRGIVYGQSLRKGMTTLEIIDHRALSVEADADLHATNLSKDVQPDTSAQLAKVSRTEQWVMQFVAKVSTAHHDREMKQTTEEASGLETLLPSLPDDTQSSVP